MLWDSSSLIWYPRQVVLSSMQYSSLIWYPSVILFLYLHRLYVATDTTYPALLSEPTSHFINLCYTHCFGNFLPVLWCQHWAHAGPLPTKCFHKALKSCQQAVILFWHLPGLCC